jgi:hypothetical protein
MTESRLSRIDVKVSKETHAAVKALSLMTGESISAVLRRSLEEYLLHHVSAQDEIFAREITRIARSLDGTLSIGDGIGSVTEVRLSAGQWVVEEAKTIQLGLLEKADGEAEGGDSPARLLTEVRSVSDEAKRLLAENPGALHGLGWRRFEEVVAELLVDHGYDVALVPQGKDTGVDIFAAGKVELGSFLYLVQCKKYDPSHPVGLPVVDRLYGRVAADRATAGIVVTTSTFTKTAKLFANKVSFQMSLRDFDSLCDWLQIWRQGS